MRRAWPAAMRAGVGLCLMLTLLGCTKRTPKPAAVDDGATSGGIIDEGIVADDSSLDAAREGRTPGEGGALRDVPFDYDSAELDEAARTVLEGNLAWIQSNERARLELEGHCDDRGTIQYNLALGARRAKAVQEYLVGQGVAADRLRTITYGKELPLCREATEACWARNRRVHTVVGR